jgi:hypothetical protein
VVDTNTGWIGRRLEQAGARVVRGAVVGDVVDDIAGAVRAAVDAVDLVVVTAASGLRPTTSPTSPWRPPPRRSARSRSAIPSAARPDCSRPWGA